MSTEEILREQIKELEKLLELKNKRLQELEKQAAPTIKFNSPINSYSYCNHEFPTPWLERLLHHVKNAV